jgi:hypothetical protein
MCASHGIEGLSCPKIVYNRYNQKHRYPPSLKITDFIS